MTEPCAGDGERKCAEMLSRWTASLDVNSRRAVDEAARRIGAKHFLLDALECTNVSGVTVGAAAKQVTKLVELAYDAGDDQEAIEAAVAHELNWDDGQPVRVVVKLATLDVDYGVVQRLPPC